ncbi:MAG: aldehyde ferredoxin oxidoreductase N-terminal domain-containing protein, partial [Dehalococcoidia bacterium]
MTELMGYAGKILRVDLSSGVVSNVQTSDYADTFLGGRGIAAKIYWDEMLPDVGPFDPESRLMFMIGPLAGFPGFGGSRWTVCGKSPLTVPEQFSYSNFGGSWGARLKSSGFDGIVVQGKSDKPVYLFVRDGAAEIRDASQLRGKRTVEVRDILKGELGGSVSSVACGPAGENRVAFAGLLADNDATGSCGFGAVMGSKNLKAIAVAGSGKAAPANPERLDELRRLVRDLKRDSIGEGQQDLVLGSKMRKDVCLGCIGA